MTEPSRTRKVNACWKIRYESADEARRQLGVMRSIRAALATEDTDTSRRVRRAETRAARARGE